MKLAYTALSPYCRKVRMAMEYKGLDFEVVTADHVTEVPAFNPRAEVPVAIRWFQEEDSSKTTYCCYRYK